jgi:16S rRNA (uracil1498-N3)-methyltransferase
MPDHAKIRVYVDGDLTSGATIALSADQAHYLGGVMRRKVGDAVRVFNGRDGEWLAGIESMSRKTGMLAAKRKLRDQTAAPTLRVLLAPLKKARFDMAVEKAVELGCGHISPVFTDNTDTGRVNAERLRALSREAAEQCGRLTVAAVDEARPLAALLDDWPEGAVLFHADETGHGVPLPQALRDADAGADHAFLIGPEGGFSSRELEILRRLPFSVGVGLGPRVLRAETAVCAALATYQAILGDAAG